MKVLLPLLFAVAAWIGVEASTPSPTVQPTSSAPTFSAPPTVAPTLRPTRRPTEAPTISPTQSHRPSTISPTSPTIRPTQAPSGPTLAPVTSAPTQTVAPTYFLPTPIPASVTIVPITSDPVALHQLIVTPPGGNNLIQLKFYDPSTTLFQFTVESLPSTGTISQLSQVFSKYGYEPKNGAPISSVPANITGSNHRLYYSRPTPDFASNHKWDSFNYVALRNDGVLSSVGTVTIVPPSGALVGSNFLLDNEKWMIVGNRALSTPSTHEPFSRGALLNYYVMGSDDLINVASSSSPDSSLWYFEAPAKYYGNLGIAYGGQLQFTLAAFSGDFSQLNDLSANVVELECAACDGPVGKGITLGFSLAAFLKSPNGAFTGAAKRITLPLLETAGWLKDSQNSLVPWTVPSQCDMIQVLSRLSRMRILGDWTTWYESVGLDDVVISNTKSRLPLCAMSVPDAKVCTC